MPESGPGSGVLDHLRERVLKGPSVRVLLLDGEDARVRVAARRLLDFDLGIEVRLLGSSEGAEPELRACFVSPDGDPDPAGRAVRWAERLRVVATQAGRALPDVDPDRFAWRDPVTYGALRLALGEEDAVVGGSTRPTADILRAALRIVGLRSPTGRLSASCLLILPDDRAYLFADVSVSPEPDSDALAEIADESARTWQSLTGERARVAFLSFSTHGSAHHPRAERVQAAAARFHERVPAVVSDGELQFDAATVPDVARRKAPESPLQGRANVLVFPDLDSANIAYKAVERLAGARAIGMILQGPAKPIHDLSRGASPGDIAAMALVAAAQAQAQAGGDAREGESS